MSFGEYLSAKSVLLCMTGIGGLYLAMVFYFCGLSASLVAILLGSGLLLAAVCFVTGWRRTDRRLRRLRSRLDVLPEKYLIGETMELPVDPLEREYYQMMKEISRSAIGAGISISIEGEAAVYTDGKLLVFIQRRSQEYFHPL